jgi:uncharacterized protein (DUF433 family)
MTFAELRQRISTLNLVEKAEILQELTQTLGNGSAGITKTIGICGGDACIGNMRIPVWTLVNYRRLGANDAAILKAFPQLSAADLVNAWAYAEAYTEEIEQTIRENAEAMQVEEV